MYHPLAHSFRHCSLRSNKLRDFQCQRWSTHAPHTACKASSRASLIAPIPPSICGPNILHAQPATRGTAMWQVQRILCRQIVLSLWNHGVSAKSRADFVFRGLLGNTDPNLELADEYPPERGDSSSGDRPVIDETRLVNRSLFSLNVLYTWREARRYLPCVSYSIKAPLCFYPLTGFCLPCLLRKASAFS